MWIPIAFWEAGDRKSSAYVHGKVDSVQVLLEEYDYEEPDLDCHEIEVALDETAPDSSESAVLHTRGPMASSSCSPASRSLVLVAFVMMFDSTWCAPLRENTLQSSRTIIAIEGISGAFSH